MHDRLFFILFYFFEKKKFKENSLNPHPWLLINKIKLKYSTLNATPYVLILGFNHVTI